MLILIIIFYEMLIKMSKLIDEFTLARKAVALTQAEQARKAGLSRMTVQKVESGAIDPRLSSLEVLARALGMEIMLVPSSLRSSLEDFVRSGGKFLGQPAGIGAPASVVDDMVSSLKSDSEGQ